MNGDQKRRRLSTRAAVTIGAVLLVVPIGVQAAVAAAPPDAAPPTSCEISRLPVPAGAFESEVAGADPTGRYMVGRDYNSEQFSVRQALIWDNEEGTVQAVDIPGTSDQLAAVNSKGDAVGWSFDGTTPGYATPWVYRDGKLSRLAGIESGNAVDINERGDILGYESTSSSAYPRPVVWRAGSDAPEFLRTPPNAPDIYPYAIGDDGTAVAVDSTSLPRRALYWPAGDPNPRFLPEARNDEGELGEPGAMQISGNTITAAVFVDRTGERWTTHWDLTDLGPPVTISTGINFLEDANEQGWIVGMTESDWKGGAWFSSPAGGDMRLEGLSDGDSLDDIATTVSEDGRVIGGQAVDENFRLRAVTWTCS